MPFTDQEYFEVIEKNEIVKKAFENYLLTIFYLDWLNSKERKNIFH